MAFNRAVKPHDTATAVCIGKKITGIGDNASESCKVRFVPTAANFSEYIEALPHMVEEGKKKN